MTHPNCGIKILYVCNLRSTSLNWKFMNQFQLRNQNGPLVFPCYYNKLWKENFHNLCQIEM